MKARHTFLVGTVLVILILNTIVPAFGDGFTQENLPPATLGDRQAGLFIKVNPTILTVDSVNNASIFLRFYDANTNQTIQHVSYFIKVEKGGELLVQDLFHTHSGELTLKIRPTQGPVTIYGGKEPILNGWIEEGGPIVVQGPVFLEGGLYHFSMEIFGVDFDNNIFKPEDAPKFDAWLSVGDITSSTITYQQKSYPIEVISYYDKIKDFSFDPRKDRISYIMPFDWNLQRLEKNPVFVHEEMYVPRNFTLLASGGFSGTLNERQLPSDTVMVDDSNPEFYVVHYMIKKEYILNVAKEMETTSNVEHKDAMVFTLSSKENVSSGTDMAGQAMVMSNKGGINAMISWNPTLIEPNKTISFTFNFIDMRSNAPLEDVTYDFVLVKDGQELVRKQGQTTKGVGSEQFAFMESQTGSITLKLENVNKSGESVGLSINVVPEFSISLVALLMAAAFGTAVIAGRRVIKFDQS